MVGDNKRRTFLKLVGLGVALEGASSAGSSLRLSVDGGETRPSEPIRIGFELTNDGGEAARRPRIRFGPPQSGWRSEAFVDDGGQRIRSDSGTAVVGWEWPSLAVGETVRPSYALRPPADAEPGAYVVTARPVGPRQRAQATTATVPGTTTRTRSRTETPATADPVTEVPTTAETSLPATTDAPSETVTADATAEAVTTEETPTLDVTAARTTGPPSTTVTVRPDDAGFVDILSVDPSNYPDVQVNVSVATEAGRNGELTAADFRLVEDGVRKTIESFRFRNVAVDLAFVFDDTGSMSEEIAAMKREVKDLTDAIEAAGIDARYALVSFKDEVEVDRRFTDDATELKDAVDRLAASGGDDDPEDNFDAIVRTLGFDFRAAAQKVVVDITDAVSHYRGDGSDVSNYTLPEVATAISERGVTYFAVAPPTNDPEASKRALAAETDGHWLDVSEADFGDILDRITELVVTAYVLRYRTDAPRGGSRDIGVEVDDPERGIGKDEGVVTVPEDEGVSDAFERERADKLAVAGRIDDATATDLGERSDATAACDALAAAAGDGTVTPDDAAEAVRRMRFGEQVTERFAAVIGPAGLDGDGADRYDLSRRMGRMVLDAAVNFVLGQLAIGEKLKEKVGGAFGASPGTLEVGLHVEWLDYEFEISKSVDVLDYLLDEAVARLRDGLESLLQLVLGDSAQAVEAAESGSRRVGEDVYARMTSGAISTAEEAGAVVDELVETVVGGLTDAIRGFVEQSVVVDPGDPDSFGDEVWGVDGSLAHLHEELGPEPTASGLDGNTAGARRVRDDAAATMRDTAAGVADAFDAIDAASEEWDVLDAIFDVVQAGDDADWWTLVRNFVDAVLSYVGNVLDLVKAGVGAGTLIGLALGHHETLDAIAHGGRSG